MSTRLKAIPSRAVLGLAVAVVTAVASLASTNSSASTDPALSSERRGVGTEPILGGTGVVIDPRKSLAITDQSILAGFSLFETMNTLIARGGSTIGTINDTRDLFRRWWDTQNDHANLQFADPVVKHCDDAAFESFDAFPYECPRIEGAEAKLENNPFDTVIGDSGQGYSAIGLFNRFDLAAADGSDCGEYRMIFARNSGKTNGRKRNLIIFEAVLPNPTPALGLQGCLPVAEFWHDLASVSAATRATRLHKFYFDGLAGFSPVVHPDNYGAGASGHGQIRTNQFMQSNWMLREFKMSRQCPSPGVCTLKITPSTVKTNPFGGLFSGAHSKSANFQNDFVTNQVLPLTTADINLFNYFPPETFNAKESDVQDVISDYTTQASTAFRRAITTKLGTIPGATGLNATHVLNRALALSCAGCHSFAVGRDMGGGLGAWPSSLGFTHVSEQDSDVDNSGPDGPRFRISNALTDVFLPHRKRVLEGFLDANGVPGP
ncbi:hypothetical protein [Dokdonella sp.]|uniref:hypothetical protein n=1 Tax=Dokdonella sp. TaxID=2291710 RepID=UPI001B13C936|nr:hypothetical protein [Dokdonella sp.]MBO9664395.1 hypothetical protein [Dokdonella sp.]